MMKRYMGIEEFKKVKEITELNDNKSMMYTKKIMSELLNSIAESLKKRQREEMRPYLRDTDEDTKKILKNAASGDKEAQNELENLLRNVYMEKEIEKFGDKTEFFEKNSAGMGTDLKFSERKSTLDKVEVSNIEAMSNKIFDRIADLTKKQNLVDRYRENVTGYYTTKDISKAIRKEFAMPEDILLAKMASGELLALERQASKKGAFYILLDKSSSMEIENDVWAKSVAYALYKKALSENRKYYIRPFDFSPHERFNKRDEIETVLLRSRTGGGTDINKAISVAVLDIKHNNELKKRVNTIILITDGKNKVHHEPLSNMLKKVNCKLISIMIKYDNEELRRISDVYMKVEEYNEESAFLVLKEILRYNDK